MILVQNILVDENIVSEKFSCDTARCKGACCTLEGGGGAPLTSEEAEIMQGLYDIVEQYLSPESRKVVQKNPISLELGEHSTTCIDNRACCFVFYENGAAKCSIERAFFDGKTSFRKPLSCHLFPLRAGDFGGSYIFYERFGECAPGREKGVGKDIYLLDELQAPLQRAFGEAWLADLNKQVAALRAKKNAPSNDYSKGME